VLELVDVQRVDRDEHDQRVLEHVCAHPGDSTRAVEDAVTGSRRATRESLARLEARGEVAPQAGRHPRTKHWYPANHADVDSPGDLAASLGETSPGLSDDVSRLSPRLYRKAGESGDSFDDVAPEELSWR
jgi:hypothetical protein